jgi:V/A-type H+/Na+-transporting ATPase subunit F
MTFYCIGDADTVRAFRLAGVAGSTPDTPAAAAAALERLCAQPGLGVVILTQRLAAGIRQQVEAIRLQRNQPLLVEIPGPEGPLPGRKSLRQLVQEAVGVAVGIEKEGL